MYPERIASGDVRSSIKRLAAPAAIVAGAVLLRVIAGVGFVNYDTLYALAWGGQLSRGSSPAYEVPIAPTPHPLIELLGIVLAPLGPKGILDVTVALAFLALSACAWVIYALGSRWFSHAVGALAALLFITRVPVLSYGVRAYIDLPYLLLVLSALLVESRRTRAGAPVLALLALAGLLRPEAWAFSALYWLYLFELLPELRRSDGRWRLAWRQGSFRAAWSFRASAGARRAVALANRLADPARGRSAAGVDAQRSRDRRQPVLVADQHPPHRPGPRPRHRDRQRARVHPPPDR